MRIDDLRVLDWHALDTRLVWIYEGPPVVRSGKVGGNRQLAWLLRRGTATINCRGERTQAKAGQWLFPPFNEVDREFSTDAQLLSICTSLQWSNGRFLFELIEPLVCDSVDLPELEVAATPLLALAVAEHAGTDNAFLFEKISLDAFLRCSELFAAWVRAYLTCMQRLGVAPYIMDSLAERPRLIRERMERLSPGQPFNPDNLAAEFGMSTRQLNRIFVAAYGVTPHSYWQARRLEAAKAALNVPNSTVKEVAYQLGFASPALFSRWFHQFSGSSPSDFRLGTPVPQQLVAHTICNESELTPQLGRGSRTKK